MRPRSSTAPPTGLTVFEPSALSEKRPVTVKVAPATKSPVAAPALERETLLARSFMASDSLPVPESDQMPCL